MQNGKRETFVQSPQLKKENLNRISSQENSADNFAKAATATPEIRNAFFISSFSGDQTQGKSGSQSGRAGRKLPRNITDSFKSKFDIDFSNVLIHADSESTQLQPVHERAAGYPRREGPPGARAGHRSGAEERKTSRPDDGCPCHQSGTGAGHHRSDGEERHHRRGDEQCRGHP